MSQDSDAPIIQSKNIVMMPISEIVPNPKNPNKHPPEQIDRLAKLIQYSGFRNPLVVSERTGLLVVGHGRLEAAIKIGMTEVPVMTQWFKDDEMEYSYMIADNGIGEWASMDLKQINIDFLDLGPDLNVDMLGLKDFVIEPLDKFGGGCGDDEVPEVKDDPITNRGDVWLLGDHRVMCGDSTLIDDVDTLMNGKKADMVFTDPPYGYSYESNHQDKHSVLKNDDKILDFMPIAHSLLSSNGTIYLCTSHQVIDKWKPLFEDSFNYKNLIVWKKNNWSMGDLKGSFAGQHELIIFGSKGNGKMIGKRDTDIWSFDRAAPDKHPTTKPVDLVEYALSKWQSGKVADLFLGSGTTLIACEKTNRKCYGMEIDEHYVDVIIERWQKFTGKKAVLEATGESYDNLRNPGEMPPRCS